MKQTKHILISLLFIVSTYTSIMWLLIKASYKDKPIAFVTNNYYSWKGGDTYQKFKEFNKREKHDIIFVGSSRAYRGYSPYVFANQNLVSFNLGTSAQSIKNTFFVIKNYIDTSNCKLLLLDVFIGAFTKDQLESTSDLIENISLSSAAKDIALSNLDVRTLNLYTLRYLTENDTAYFTKSDYIGKGYSSTSDSLPKQKQQQYFMKQKLVQKEVIIDEEQLNYFERIIQLCKERSLKLICVYSPVSYFYDMSQHQNFISKVYKVMVDYKVPFYDLSNLDSINTAYHFYDDAHLNQHGVEIFNRHLIFKLKQDSVFYASNRL